MPGRGMKVRRAVVVSISGGSNFFLDRQNHEYRKKEECGSRPTSSFVQ
jgi:hypothetical protein